MQPADARQPDDLARRTRTLLEDAATGSFFLQSDVRAVLVIVADVLLAQSK